MMWLQWWLCLLYLLQVVVFVGMIAGYIYDVPNAKPPPSEKRPQVAPFQLASEGPEREKISRSKPSVKMKAIPLSYLKDNLFKVSSRLELIRLFMDSDVDDHLLSHWMSRTIRSIPHSAGDRLKRNQAFLQNKETLTQQSGSTFDANKVSKQKDKSFHEHMASAMKNVISALDENVDDDGIVDADYYIDYPQDESTEDTQDQPTQESLEAFEAALHHIDETNFCQAFKCREPTPFVHRVKDGGHIFLPECVVLHRCMNYSGCCGDGNECVPKRMNIVTKDFLMVDRFTELEDHVVFNPKMATTLTFVNHTECECREKPSVPKCTKFCPTHFRLSQEGAHCRCGCFPMAHQDGWPCESVRDGLVPLSHDQLVCIKNSNCYSPECTVGEFDIKTGFCPLSDEYAIPALFFQNPDERRFYREHLSSYDFTKPRTTYAQSDRAHETGSFLSQYSGVQDHQKETGEEMVKRDPALLGSTETPTVRSWEKRSELGSETKLKHSVLDTQNISTNSLAFSYKEAKLSAPQSKNLNVSASLTSSDTSSEEIVDSLVYHTTTVFDKDNNDHLNSRDNFSNKNITNKLNQLDALSPVLPKTNGNSENAEETRKTPAYSRSDTEVHDEDVVSKITSRTSDSTPDTVKNVVPTLSWLGSGVTHSSSETSTDNFKTPYAERSVPVENGDRFGNNVLKNILKLQLNSHQLHENYRPVRIPSSPYTVGNDIKTSSSKATPTSSSVFTPLSSSKKQPRILSSLYPPDSSFLPTTSTQTLSLPLKTSQQTPVSD